MTILRSIPQHTVHVWVRALYKPVVLPILPNPLLDSITYPYSTVPSPGSVFILQINKGSLLAPTETDPEWFIRHVQVGVANLPDFRKLEEVMLENEPMLWLSIIFNCYNVITQGVN
jgi:hypothetical protein